MAGGGLHRGTARLTALLVAVVTLVLACWLAWAFPAQGGPFAVIEGPPLAGVLDVHFHLGLDGLSVWMFVLSAVLMLTSVLVSWDAIRDREP